MHQIEYLPDILILLATAVFVVAIFKRLNLSPVLGYLVAGAAIGPYGIALIDTTDGVDTFAEFGIVFLLFSIGLELTFERLMAMRRHVFGFGTAQVIITGIILGVVAYLWGVSAEAAIIIGGGLALSSTAIVLQVLADSNRQATQVGRLSLAVLILQDFAVMPLLVLVPLLASDSANILGALGNALVEASIALVLIFILGRVLIRPLFRVVGALKSEELFMAVILLVVLGAAFLTEHHGLSLALGAFVAGLMVAETEYQQLVEADIIPYKGLLLGLFFMTVGMSVDIQSIIKHLPLITVMAIALLVAKAVVISILCRVFGFPTGASIHAGLLLSQGGEFAFVLFSLAAKQDIIPDDIAQTLLLVVAMTMALTPLLSSIGNWISMKIDTIGKGSDDKLTSMEAADLDKHVIVIGFGRVGRSTARLLAAECVNYIILDIDFKRVKQGRAEGFPIHHGDPGRLRTLESIGINRAEAVVLTVRNDITIKKVSKIIHTHFPDLPIIIRSEDLDRASKLAIPGENTIIVPETFEMGLQLGSAVLRALGIPDHEIVRVKERFRSSKYALAKRNVTLLENGE